jgi:formylglycine-generating enzyme required for sulfatase activity
MSALRQAGLAAAIGGVLLMVSACSGKEPESASTLSAQAAGKASAASVAASIQMVDVPGGKFIMGAPSGTGFQNGYPPHEVSVKPFRLGKYEVTFAQYDAFARATGRPLPADEGWGRDDRPVIHVSWSDIHAFIDWLNQGADRKFRLASESEWEYAARGGTTTLYWWGDEPNPDFANAVDNSGKDKWEATAPVGQFPANDFGLHDVLGNVWEVVADCRYPDYEGAPNDGSARLGGDCDSRMVRGGFYGSIRLGMQIAARAAVGEQFENMGVGFRLAE